MCNHAKLSDLVLEWGGVKKETKDIFSLRTIIYKGALNKSKKFLIIHTEVQN